MVVGRLFIGDFDSDRFDNNFLLLRRIKGFENKLMIFSILDHFSKKVYFLKDDAAQRKKTDKPQPDDMEDIDDDETAPAGKTTGADKMQEGEGDKENGSKKSPKKSPASPQHKPNKADLEVHRCLLK